MIWALAILLVLVSLLAAVLVYGLREARGVLLVCANALDAAQATMDDLHAEVEVRTVEREAARHQIALQAASLRDWEQAETIRLAVERDVAARAAEEADAAALVVARAEAQLAHGLEMADELAEARVRTACQAVGLDDARFSRDLDLSATGKTGEVLHHAAQGFLPSNPLRTAGDVIDLFVGRP